MRINLALGCTFPQLAPKAVVFSLSACHAGADVVVTDVPQRLQACREVAQKVKGMGREALAVAADVTDQVGAASPIAGLVLHMRVS